MDYQEYKGYKGSVEYSKVDNCLFGKVQGMSKDLIRVAAFVASTGTTINDFINNAIKSDLKKVASL